MSTAKELKAGAEELREVTTDPDLTVVTGIHGTVKVHKCRGSNIADVLELIAAVMQEFGIEELGKMPSMSDEDLSKPVNFLPLITKLSDRVFITASGLTSLSYEEFVDMQIDDLLKVLIKVVEVNKDFFLKSVLPLAKSVLPSGLATTTEEETV